MIHYSCDRCKRPIEASEGVRYVVKMEIEAELNTGGCDDCSCDCDVDHLQEIDEVLETMQNESECFDESPLYEKKRFDLCPECYKAFIKNPLSREKMVPFGFSKN
ncbi:MAG: hypothetical protein U0892_09535 [Pirellulales bacterium]